MKNKWVWFVVAILIIVAIALKIFVPSDKEVDKPVNINVGDEFTAFDFDKPKYVLNYKIADFTGNGVNDMAILIGEKESIDSISSSNIDIVLYNSDTATYSKMNLKKFNGSSPRIENTDLTGDGIPEIVAYVQDEDGTYKLRVATFNNELIEIFKEKNNKGIYFTVKFLDGFKVNIVNRKLNLDNTLDVSAQKENYINLKIFEESGKLKNTELRGKTTGFTSLEFVQLSDQMGLKTVQKIIAEDPTNIIDEITVIWKYENGKWEMKEALGVRQGNLLY